MALKFANLRMYDEEIRAYDGLKAANYNVSAVLRSLLVAYAKEKGILSDDKTQKRDNDGNE